MDLCPAAIIFNTVNPILAQGAAQAGITMLAGFEGDITSRINSGARLRLDPERKTVEVLG
jgi:predicted aconitase with swiveling domain